MFARAFGGLSSNKCWNIRLHHSSSLSFDPVKTTQQHAGQIVASVSESLRRFIVKWMFDYSVAPLIITLMWASKNSSITRRSNKENSREPLEVYRCTKVRLFGCTTHHHSSETVKTTQKHAGQLVANVRESLRRFIVKRMLEYSIASLIITLIWHSKNNSTTCRSNSSEC